MTISSAGDFKSWSSSDFADTSAVTAKLESYSDIGSGNVSVTVDGSGLVYTIEFIVALANTNITELAVSGAALTKEAGSSTLTELVVGVAGVQEVQEIQLSTAVAPEGGSLAINGTTVANGPAFSAADIEAAVESATGKGCSVSGPHGTQDYTVTFDSPENVAQLNLTGTNLNLDDGGGQIAVTEAIAGGSGSNEVQHIAAVSFPFGVFLTFDGVTATATIGPGEDASTAQAALETIPALAGNVSVTGISIGSGGLDVEFINGLADTDVPLIGYRAIIVVSISTTTQGVTPVKQRWRVALPASTTGGTYELAGSGGNNAQLSWDSTSAAIDFEIETSFGQSVTIASYTSSLLYEIEWDVSGPFTLTEAVNALTKAVTPTIDTLSDGSALVRNQALTLMGCC